MPATLITLTQGLFDRDAEQFIAALNDPQGDLIPETVGTSDPITVYHPYGKPNKNTPEHNWYINFLGLSEGVREIDPGLILQFYTDLAIRQGEFTFASDQCHFILTAARRISKGPRFYRQDGINVFRFVRELVDQLDLLDHRLIDIGPVANPRYPQVVRVGSKSNRS